uniref:NADH-ubiquinone oxidoreductase chain 4L n=1 Tax=Scydosella musawasensis TaxID=1819563 RepID=A0A161G0T2_9COLE|nr:NADH dehydrogenase subunit 4L [Scydosella musawasensis]
MFISMVFMGLLSFSFNQKHLLLMLLILEFIVLSLYLNMYYIMGDYLYMNWMIIYLSMSVCEGVLGLSLLITLIRSHGNDYFLLYNILW